MEETPLLEKKFPFPETEDNDDPWEFIFHPNETKEIVGKDMDTIKWLMLREVPGLISTSDRNEETIGYAHKAGVKLCISSPVFSSIPTDEQQKLKGRVDVEKKVLFYPLPLTHNWSPLVLGSWKATLLEPGSNHFVMSASLPATCHELKN